MTSSSPTISMTWLPVCGRCGEDTGLFTAVPLAPTAGHHRRLAAEDLTTAPSAR
ncbi:hypothetical protein [Streptomyces albiaxialis]|uniref:hypothetical protein n=1 Tax=Streptomyces albiaxialis TaxID=329523 RepID=UPI0031CDF76C